MLLIAKNTGMHHIITTGITIYLYPDNVVEEKNCKLLESPRKSKTRDMNKVPKPKLIHVN